MNVYLAQLKNKLKLEQSYTPKLKLLSYLEIFSSWNENYKAEKKNERQDAVPCTGMGSGNPDGPAAGCTSTHAGLRAQEMLGLGSNWVRVTPEVFLEESPAGGKVDTRMTVEEEEPHSNGLEGAW